MICTDCGKSAGVITPETLARGSAVRDPGEAVCPSCTSSRTRLIRKLRALPERLDQIQAQRARLLS